MSPIIYNLIWECLLANVVGNLIKGNETMNTEKKLSKIEYLLKN